MSRTLVAVFAIVLFASCVHAAPRRLQQTQYTANMLLAKASKGSCAVRVTVVDAASQQAVVGATVSLLLGSGSTPRSGITNAEGRLVMHFKATPGSTSCTAQVQKMILNDVEQRLTSGSQDPKTINL